MRQRLRALLSRLPGWIDRLWPWGPIVLVVLAVLAGLNSIAKQPPKNDYDQINDLVHDFGTAVDAKRGDDACGMLTDTGRTELVAQVPTVTCEVAVRSFGLGFDPKALADAHINGIDLQGTTAAIAPAKLLTGGDVPIGLSLRFQKVDGRWKISALGRPPIS